MVKLSKGIIGYERVAIIHSFGISYCGKCNRKLPSDNPLKHKWITNNGCIWCDTEYHMKKTI